MTRRKAAGAAALPTAALVSSGVAFLMAPYLTSNLGPAQFGLMTLYLSITPILGTVFTACGPGLIPVEYVKGSGRSARQLRWTNVNLATILASCSLFLALLAGAVIQSTTWTIAAAVVVALSYLQALNAVDLSYLRVAQLFGLATTGLYLLTFVNVIATVALFETLGPSASSRLAALALATLVVQILYSVLYFRRYRRSSRPTHETHRADRRRLVDFGVSLLPHHASYWVRSGVDRYLLVLALGTYATGIYGLTLILASVLVTLFTSASQACQPFLYRMFEAGDVRGATRIRFAFMVGVICSTVIFDLAVRAGFDYVFPSEFRPSLRYLEVMLLTAAMQGLYFIYSQGPFFALAGRQISKVTMTALVIHLAGLVIVIPMGVSIMAVCVVSAISTGVALLLMIWLARQTRGAAHEVRLRADSGVAGSTSWEEGPEVALPSAPRPNEMM